MDLEHLELSQFIDWIVFAIAIGFGIGLALLRALWGQPAVAHQGLREADCPNIGL